MTTFGTVPPVKAPNWPYMAAVFEFYGRLFLHKGPTSKFHNLQMMVTQSQDPVLHKELQQRWGGHITYRDEKPCIWICTSANAVREILTGILPHLRRRGEEVRLAHQLAEMIPQRGRRTPEENVEMRLQLTEQFQKYQPPLPPEVKKLDLNERLRMLYREARLSYDPISIELLNDIALTSQVHEENQAAFDNLVKVAQATGMLDSDNNPLPATERSHEREVTNGENDIDNQQQREGESVQNP